MSDRSSKNNVRSKEKEKPEEITSSHEVCHGLSSAQDLKKAKELDTMK